MVVFTLSNMFVQGVLPNGSNVYATAGVVVVCLTVALVAYRRGVGSFDIWKLGDIAFVLSLAGLLGSHLSTLPGGIASSLCTNAGSALFNVLLIVSLGSISYRYGVNSTILFGFAKSAECLAFFAGSALVSMAGKTTSDGFTLLVSALSLLLAVGFVMFAEGRGENPSWGVGLDSGKPDKPVTETTIRHRCSELSREAGLTRREEEVLVLLAHDMPASEIEHELCVSNATVKTHTRAVYRKLNVHSRREIVGLVGAGLENAEFSKRA